MIRQLPAMTARDIVAFVTSGLVGGVVAVGPCVWESSDGTAARVWYFMICRTSKKGFDCIRIDGVEPARASVVAGLIAAQPPLVVHAFEHEVDMIRFCALQWPSETMEAVRKTVEADYKNRGIV